MADLLPKRMRYFDGQFLTEKDFQEEQAYLLNRHYIHNRALHTTGIAEGLEVNARVGDNRLVVQPGVALDQQGREIVLPAESSLEQAALNALPNQKVLLVISYVETPTDLATKGTRDNTRFTESPLLELVTAPADLAAPAPANEPRLNPALYIRLALVTLSPRAGGVVTITAIDNSVRVFAGTNIRGEIELTKLNLTTAGLPPDRRPSLSVRQIPGTGGTPVTSAYLSGLLQVSVGLNVDGAINAPQVNTGTLSVTNLIQWGNSSALNGDQGGSLELGGNNNVAGTGTPYIDFHFRGKQQDFNTRIINDADGRLSIGADTLSVTGNLQVGSFVIEGQARGRFNVAGPAAEISISRQDLTAWPATAVAGDRFVWYNANGSNLRLWTNPSTDIFWIGKDGSLEIAETASISFKSRTRQMLNLYSTAYGIGVQGYTMYFRTNGHFGWYKDGVHVDDAIEPGQDGKALMYLNANAALVVGNRFGANISGGPGGGGVFGSNLATLNGNDLYTPFKHDANYGYAGVRAIWGKLEFFTASGDTKENEVLTNKPDFAARLTVHQDGNVGIGTIATPAARLHVTGNAPVLALEGINHAFIEWYPLGVAAGRKGWIGYGNAGATELTIRNDAGRMHIYGEELLYLLNKSGVIISKDWGGNGNLTVQGSLQVTGGAIIPRVGNSSNAGIYFPTNPGGGGGDEAFIRYFVDSGESTQLAIGNYNDADDSIGFWQAGAQRMSIRSGRVFVNAVANNAEAAALLATSPNGTVIIGGPNGSAVGAVKATALFFYWKDQIGQIGAIRLQAALLGAIPSSTTTIHFGDTDV